MLPDHRGVRCDPAHSHHGPARLLAVPVRSSDAYSIGAVGQDRCAHGNDQGRAGVAGLGPGPLG